MKIFIRLLAIIVILFNCNAIFTNDLFTQALLAKFGGCLPTNQQAKIVAPNHVRDFFQGYSVSLSADGNTLAIGNALVLGGTLGDKGATWIYVRSGTNWVQQQKLVGTGSSGNVFGGGGVSLSADGNTLAVGSIEDNNGIGATWVYTRSGNKWTPQQKLSDLNALDANQGRSVSLSGDGRTLAVGGNGDNDGTGATWIYTRSGNTWIQQGPKLSDPSGLAQGVDGVSLSNDGNTLAVGGSDNNHITATWIYTRSGTTWKQQGSKLVIEGVHAITPSGFSVSLSKDGNTLAIGGPTDDNFKGATWIFTRSGNTWTQQGPKLIGSGVIGVATQGFSVSLSADGNTLAVGGPGDNFKGATWIFTRKDTKWTQQGSKLVGKVAIGAASQGSSVSLSARGNTLAVGGVSDNNNIGATWIFT
jgi:hypothetical protein